MDAPDLDPARHVQALRALARLNRISGVAARVWRDALRLSRERRAPGMNEPLRILDVACGGGDIVINVARRARSAAVPLEVHGSFAAADCRDSCAFRLRGKKENRRRASLQ